MENIALVEILSLVPLLSLIVSIFIYYQSVKERHYKEAEESTKVTSKLEKLDEAIGKIEKIQKYLTNDKEALETHRSAINGLSRNQRKMRGVISSNTNGVMLCMQHEVKGNHTELLEEWMRHAATSAVSLEEVEIDKEE